MSHLAYFLAAVLCLISFVCIGLAFMLDTGTPIHLWLAGFVLWLVVLFIGKR